MNKAFYVQKILTEKMIYLFIDLLYMGTTSHPFYSENMIPSELEVELGDLVTK